MSKETCLQWNDFQNNARNAFRNLREDKDFADVTLVCDDGQQVAAHKVILAASTPIFQEILRQNKHPHPLIFMRGVKLGELKSIVDFLYLGEANVHQENLDSFLAIAKDLQMKGLSNEPNTSNCENDPPPPLKSELQLEEFYHVVKSDPNKEAENEPNQMPSPLLESETNFVEIRTNPTIDLNPTSISNAARFSGDFQELDEMVASMMEKSQNLCRKGKQKAYKCKVCGKEAKGKDIKDHIEANHIEGIVIPCNLCDKTFRSTKILKMCLILFSRTRSASRAHSRLAFCLRDFSLATNTVRPRGTYRCKKGRGNEQNNDDYRVGIL